MKPDQTRYAKERIQKVLSAYEAAQKSKFTTPAKELTEADKLQLIRDEAVDLLWPRTKLRPRMTLFECFNFNDAEMPEKFDGKKFSAAMAPVRREAANVMDQIMLGDSAKAIELVTEFVKKYGAAE